MGVKWRARLVDIEGFSLGHVEAPLNVNEKQLVEELLLRVLGGCVEVELLAADSQFESQGVFDLLESLKIGSVIAWRRLKGRVNPPDVLTVKEHIELEGPEWKSARPAPEPNLLLFSFSEHH